MYQIAHVYTILQLKLLPVSILLGISCGIPLLWEKPRQASGGRTPSPRRLPACHGQGLVTIHSIPDYPCLRLTFRRVGKVECLKFYTDDSEEDKTQRCTRNLISLREATRVNSLVGSKEADNRTYVPPLKARARTLSYQNQSYIVIRLTVVLYFASLSVIRFVIPQENPQQGFSPPAAELTSAF